MDHALVLFVLLCSSGFLPGLQTEEDSKEIDDIQLVGGSSRCSGKLQVKHQGVWMDVDDDEWDLKLADVVCRHLDCGSVVRASSRYSEWDSSLWRITPSCLTSQSRLRKCLTKRSTIAPGSLEIICSQSIRLVNGTSLCSGRLEVKSHQSEQFSQSWSSVCTDDFNQQDAEVVCRELGCGPPSVLQGALYGDMEAPVRTKEFQCGGHESALLDCRSSDSDRNTCSSGKAVGLTCSEPDNVRLVRGSSRCAGELGMNLQGQWGNLYVDMGDWNLKTAHEVCRKLDCGSAVSTGWKSRNYYTEVWPIRLPCLHSKSALRECVLTRPYTYTFVPEVKCSESIRLVNGTGLCSGRLEVKSHQSNQRWSSVHENDFDLQDAEVVCRELGCGPPSVLQGALYGDVDAPMWTKKFQCEGNESALLDCRSSDRNTSSPGRAVGLTCSEPDEVRLVGGTSHCDGRLEMKHEGAWRQVVAWRHSPDTYHKWDLMSAAVVCRRLDCGSAISTEGTDFDNSRPWILASSCAQSTMRECTSLWFDSIPYRSLSILEVTCSDFLVQPNISFSIHTDGVSEATQQGFKVLIGSSFTISCSILPQKPGGSFQLILTTSATTQSYALPAVNHSAHFLFSAADRTHRGEYRCVYHIYFVSQNVSSESQPLCLTVSASTTHLIIRLLVLLLSAMVTAALFVYCKATRGQTPGREDSNELDYLGGAGDMQDEEAGGAQGTECGVCIQGTFLQETQ